ncbi:hypothetical protein H5410_042192 [Solanum commersonii]|uniref:Uncharacterized protein n=1 Tax=Solanum commersonii TaxID=4109 RepID=A0A9J5XXS4_SOLCO|nr:hypothetical protein H5410_042192 [Solanum commersonii]
MEPVGPDGQIGPFLSWSRCTNRLIFKVKRSLKQVNPPICQFFVCYIVHEFLVIQNFDIIFDKNFHGRPLSP